MWKESFSALGLRAIRCSALRAQRFNHVHHRGYAGRAKLGFAAGSSALVAVEALSRSLTLDLAPNRVNTLRPGFVGTETWAISSEEGREEMRTKVCETFPARLVGTSADIRARCIVLDDQSVRVTGSVHEVSGGELLVDWFF